MISFRYHPLTNHESDLRLVEIQHGQQNDDLRCTIYTRRSLVSPSYQALSYVWGDGPRKVPLYLNEKIFLVTPNLEAALRNIRCSTSEARRKQLPLWIDAMCINQEDSNERDKQVRRMKLIYQQAERVLIWLGNYIEPCDETYRFDVGRFDVGRVEENSEAKARSAIVLALALKQAPTIQDDSEVSIGLEDITHSQDLQVWAQLSRLFHRPWFERLWIIQELAVSRTAVVLWGRIQTPWQTLERAAKFILRPGEALLTPHVRKLFPLIGAARITQVSLQSMFNVDTTNILTILHNTQNTKCSDPRDRLYAILGVVDDTQDIDIDYSIPVDQVYRNWAKKRIMRTKALDILNACADSSNSGDLPSWVPDLRKPFGQNKVL